MILFLDGGGTLAARDVACVEIIRKHTQSEELISIKIEDNMDWDRVCRLLEDAHAIVLAADVYLDSVSSTVLRFLERVEQAVIGGESIGGSKVETTVHRGSLWSIFNQGTADFMVNALQEQALFIRERVQGTDVYINPKEVSRRGYIRKMNQKMKKSNRVKIAQNM